MKSTRICVTAAVIALLVSPAVAAILGTLDIVHVPGAVRLGLKPVSPQHGAGAAVDGAVPPALRGVPIFRGTAAREIGFAAIVAAGMAERAQSAEWEFRAEPVDNTGTFNKVWLYAQRSVACETATAPRCADESEALRIMVEFVAPDTASARIYVVGRDHRPVPKRHLQMIRTDGRWFAASSEPHAE